MKKQQPQTERLINGHFADALTCHAWATATRGPQLSQCRIDKAVATDFGVDRSWVSSCPFGRFLAPLCPFRGSGVTLRFAIVAVSNPSRFVAESLK